MITQPDASGGLGSFPSVLRGVLAQGLPLIAAGELSKRYGYSFGADGQVSVNANDGIRPAAAPGSDVGSFAAAGEYLRNPVVLVGLVALAVLAVVIVRRH